MFHALITKYSSLLLLSGILFCLSVVQPTTIPMTIHTIHDYDRGELVAEAAQLACMTKTIFLEAANQPMTGQLAVAFVIKNRSIKSGKSICEVVYEPLAFSVYNGHKRPHIDLKKSYNKVIWDQIYSLASAVDLHYNQLIDITDGALYYHTLKCKPRWHMKLVKTLVLGNHIFYKEANANETGNQGF